MSQEKALYAVIDQVRLAFNAMREIADRTHADLKITAAMRAVLERLYRTGPQTVPEMARARNVSRQHIQKIVDTLIDGGLVSLQTNPAHKRSPIVSLTGTGRQAFQTISEREEAIVAALARQLSDRDLAATARTLRALNEALEPYGGS